MLKQAVHKLLARMHRRLLKWPLSKSVAVESHIAELLQRNRPNVLFDVGAHRGETGLLFRSLGFTGRIISCEPIPENLAVLEKVAAADGDWRVLRYALGDVAESVAMHQAAGTVLCSLHTPTAHGEKHFGAAMQETLTHQVEVRRLDEVAEACLSGISEPSIYLKTDTQGHDLAVLRGATNTLRKVRVLQMETAVRPLYEGAPTFYQVYEYAQSIGFRLTGFFVGSRDKSLAVNEMDAIFVRAE